MSILTPFFNLIKPAKQDGVKVSDFNANMDTIDTEMHKPPLTVNNIEPDANRDIYIQSVPLADNLTSEEAQINIGTYLERTSGGGSSIESGEASLSTIKGNMIKTGYIPEVLDMTVNAVTRVAPPAITATIDNATFEAYVETAGTYTLTYTDSWDEDPTDYGITVSNTPVDGDEIVVVWDGENDPVMIVNAVERPVPPAITATIDKATFRAYVATSGTTTLSYTTGWSASPALYGITVQNTPVSGDSIVVNYVKENRGTITPVNVSAFNSTGWNLYDNSTGYAKVVRYSDTYGYYIGGNYSIVAFATTPTGTASAVTVNDGYFNVPSDGYIIVTGGDATTYIFPTWSDWVDGYEGDFEPYTVDTISLSSIMVSFTAGLCAVGEVRDELNFNIQKAYSRIDRLAYTADNLAAVIASGRAYDTDTNYIYVVRETPVEYSFSIDGTYSVSDHGIEYFTASTTTPVICEALYGENLKDKLRTDVVTISQQTLSSSQKAQVLTNIGAFSQADGNALNTKIADVRNYIEVGSISSKSGLDDLMNNLITNSSLSNNKKLARFSCTATFTPFVTGVSYFVDLSASSANYASAIIQGVGYAQIIQAIKVPTGWSYEPVAMNSNINDYRSNSGTSTYTSWDVKYSIIGRMCTFIFGFTPSSTISSSIGAIGNTGLPNPTSTDCVCIYPVTKVQQSYTLAETQNRFGGVKNIGSSNAEVRAVGAYETGIRYSFCGSYVIAS